MMPVILLTVQICRLFWKTSSFLILTRRKPIFVCSQGDKTQNEDRHEPPFNCFRGRPPSSRRGRRVPAPVAKSQGKSEFKSDGRGRCPAGLNQKRPSPAVDGRHRGCAAGRRGLVRLGLLDRRPLSGFDRHAYVKA